MVLPLDDDVTKFSKLWTYVTSYYYVGSGYTYQHGVCLSVAPVGKPEYYIMKYMAIFLSKYINNSSLPVQNSYSSCSHTFQHGYLHGTIFPSAAPTGKPEYYIMKLWRPSCLSKLGTWEQYVPTRHFHIG